MSAVVSVRRACVDVDVDGRIHRFVGEAAEEVLRTTSSELTAVHPLWVVVDFEEGESYRFEGHEAVTALRATVELLEEMGAVEAVEALRDAAGFDGREQSDTAGILDQPSERRNDR